VVSPATADRLLACARVSAALSDVVHLVPPERRDEFVIASAQVMGCVLGIPSGVVQSACARVTAEFDARRLGRCEHLRVRDLCDECRP